MLAKNQVIELEIESISHEGDGIARHEGVVVFIPMTAAGDRIRAKIVKVEKRFAYAIVQEILIPSRHRDYPGCQAYSQCGGCGLRHISYTHELEIKSRWVSDNLSRLGGITIDVEPIIPSPLADRYRNKAQYPIGISGGGLSAGFYARRSHRIVPVDDCVLHPEFFADICKTVLNFSQQYGIKPYNESTHFGVLRHIYLRHAQVTGQIMLCLVINSKKLPHEEELKQLIAECHPEITTLSVNLNTERTNVVMGEKTYALIGDGYILDEICGIKVRISPHSFYQVNRGAAEILYQHTLEYADPSISDTLLDLYCGIGVIGLTMAHRVGQVIGVDAVPQSVKDAQFNASQNEITNARFIKGDAAIAAKQLEKEGIRPDIVLLDPPRKGVEHDLIQCVADMRPRKIVYISCNSATLARDCKLFEALGYKLSRARPVDLFPRTNHIETLSLLTNFSS